MNIIKKFKNILACFLSLSFGCVQPMQATLNNNQTIKQASYTDKILNCSDYFYTFDILKPTGNYSAMNRFRNCSFNSINGISSFIDLNNTTLGFQFSFVGKASDVILVYAFGVYIYIFDKTQDKPFISVNLNNFSGGSLSYFNTNNSYNSGYPFTIERGTLFICSSATAFTPITNFNTNNIALSVTIPNKSIYNGKTICCIPFYFGLTQEEDAIDFTYYNSIATYLKEQYYSISNFLNNAYSIGLNNNENTNFYNNGYSAGYDAGLEVGTNDGFEQGYSAGKDEGYTNGYNIGYNKGISSNETPSSFFLNVFSAVVGVPISILNQLSGVVFWNVSLLGILLTLLFFSLILWLIRKFI